MSLTRRAVLTGLSAGLGQAALAGAPAQSILPVLRPTGQHRLAKNSAADLVARAALAGKVGFVVADARTGEVLEAMNPVLGLPPASVVKAVTAQYALETLGAEHRFVTRIIATAPVINGRIDGDLALIGGGDPGLDTNGLAEMAAALKARGVTQVTGRFLVSAGPLPHVDRIDPSQPDYLSYNPAISGLNLNYNRIYFEWKRSSSEYAISMDARSAKYRPAVQVTRMQVVDRSSPVYTYSGDDGADNWTVARGALGKGGARWLPVRQPELYAGEVFQIFARSHGIVLRAPVVATQALAGTVLVVRPSRSLGDILRRMLKASTNLTAEVAGLSASVARGRAVGGLPASGREMARWMRTAGGARKPRFVDHSGLGDGTRLSASDLVATLVHLGADGALAGLLPKVVMRNARGNLRAGAPVELRAKTGTLNFVSGLSGYARVAGGSDLAFAIFAADLPRRGAIKPADRERPRGARSWSSRARVLQWGLLDRWVSLYG